MDKVKKIFTSLLPFWIALTLSKLGSGLYYGLIAPLGERYMPLWIVGLLVGGGSFIQLLLDVPIGNLLDKFGYLRFLRLAFFVFMFTGLFIIPNLGIVGFLLSLLAATIGWLFFEPSINAYILSHAPKEDAGEFFSFRDVFNAIGIVLSVVALGYLLLLSNTLIGGTIAVVLFIAWICLFFVAKDKVKISKEPAHPLQASYIHRHYIHQIFKVLNRLNPASTMLLLLNLSSSIFYAVVWFVIPLELVHQAHSSWLNLGLGAFDLAIVLSGLFLGHLADRANRRLLVLIGLLMFSVSGLILSFNFSWPFLVFSFLASVGDEMTGVSLWTWLHSLDKDHGSDGLLSGLITLAYDLGWAIGPIMAGILYYKIGPSWTIATSAFMIFITWVIYVFVSRKYKFLPIISPLHKPHHPRYRT